MFHQRTKTIVVVSAAAVAVAIVALGALVSVGAFDPAGRDAAWVSDEPSAGGGSDRNETELERLQRVTGSNCSAARNVASARADIGFFCLPFDAIPAIDEPSFAPASDYELPAREPVVVAEVDGAFRAYPVRIMVRHEIVNDEFAGTPVAVTFCPLCNSAVGFVREAEGEPLTFGVSGQLISANLVMFDRQTLSMWRQVTGEAYAGELKGTALERIPVTMVDFGSYRSAHPDAEVMVPPDPGIDYGTDPYHDYADDPRSQSRFFSAPRGSNGDRTDDRLPPKARVVGVKVGGKAAAFAMPRTGKRAVGEATVGGVRLVALYEKGVAQTARSYELAEAPAGWSAVVFRRDGGRFAVSPRGFTARGDGTVYRIDGSVVEGPGSPLELVPQATSFWFSWADTFPRTGLIRPAGS